jgi:hypothetical protein
MSKARSLSAFLSSALFVSIIALPLTQVNWKGSISAQEKRKLTAFPEWSWKKKRLKSFPKKFEEAFGERFGFRSQLVLGNSLYKVFVLGVSARPKVVLGDNGWLFYSPSLDEYRGLKTLKKEDLRLRVEDLKAKAKYFASRNIRCLFVVAPNKEEIYSEFLPTSIQRVQKNLYVDQLAAALKADQDAGDVNFMDLRQPILNAKSLGRLYHRTDTHWNQLGSCIAVNEIVSRLQNAMPNLQPAKISAQEIWTKPAPGGDLAGFLSLPDWFSEEEVHLGPESGKFRLAALKCKLDCPREKLLMPFVAKESLHPNRKGTVLLVGDSFTGGPIPFLLDHFHRVIQFCPEPFLSKWSQQIIPEIVGAEKPDVYIELIVDRNSGLSPEAPFSGAVSISQPNDSRSEAQ